MIVRIPESKSILWVLCLLSLVGRLSAAEPTPGQQVEQSFVASDGGQVDYLLYLPKANEAGQQPPALMLFLHGRGESDGPLNLVAKWGPPQMLASGQQLPFIVVSPQCPTTDSWSSPTQQKRLWELLAAVVQQTQADPQRLYLTGLSMGGSGSWRMAADHPQHFAAVVPICGRGDVADVQSLKTVPLWVFVGDQDGVYEPNVKMVEALRQAGSQTVRFTTLEHIGHNSWSAAYASPDLYSWLAQQTTAKK
jgi:predicted peptidase